MTHIIDSRSKRRPAKIAAGLALSALLLLGPLVTMARAEQQGVQDNTSERNRARSSRDLAPEPGAQPTLSRSGLLWSGLL